jgi:hypothetical protein
METRPAPGQAGSMLDALHTEASSINLTPGWLPRKKPIMWPQPDRIRSGALEL